MVIVFDDQTQRVAIYGPLKRRFLIDNVTLVVDPIVRRDFNNQILPALPLRFRVSCRVLRRASPGRSGKFGIAHTEDIEAGIKPDGDKGQVNLAWSIHDEDGDLVKERTEKFDSADISDILRYLWTRGMGPHEVMGFCVQAKDQGALAVTLGYNHRRMDVSRIPGE